MAKIPVHDSQGQLSKQSDVTVRDVSLAGQKGRNWQAAGKGFSALAEKYDESKDLNAEFDAKTKFMEKRHAYNVSQVDNDDLESEMKTFDTETETGGGWDVYRQEIMATSMEGVSPEVQSKLFYGFNQSLNQDEISYKTKAVRQQQDKTLASYGVMADKISKVIGIEPLKNAVTMIELLDTDGKKILAAGHVSGTDSQKKIKQTQSFVARTYLQDIMKTNPERAQDILNGGELDQYLTVDEWNDQDKKATSKRDFLDNEYKDGLKVNEHDQETDLILKSLVGVDDPQLAQKSIAEGVRPQVARLIEGMYFTTRKSPENNASYVNIKDDLFNLDMDKGVDMDAIADVRLKIATMMDEGVIRDESVRELMADITDISDSPESQLKFAKRKETWNYFTYQADRYDPERTDTAKTYLSKRLNYFIEKDNLKPEQYMEMAEKVYKNYMVEEHPEITDIDSVPNAVLTVDGTFKSIFEPDRQTSAVGDYQITKIETKKDKS